MTCSASTLGFVLLTVSTFLSIETSASIYEKCNTSGNIFNCSGVGLLLIPEETNIPTDTDTLDLSYNHISNIHLLNYSSLSNSLLTLDLSNNQIVTIANDAFTFLTHLVTLDLSENLISGNNLQEYTFYDFKKLLNLNLEKNPLRNIKKDTFSFLQLFAVKRLDLSHCEIGEVEANFIDLPSLEWLDLSWNQIQTFSRDSFGMLRSLKTLDMSHNRLTVLNEVPYMPELVTWILDSNGMDEIAIREEIEDYADKLQKLYLRNNDILRFDVDSLPLELDTMQVIDMSGNKLHCDCRMKWIRTGGYGLTGKNYTFTCGYPSRVENNNLLTMAPEDLKCGDPLVTVLFIYMVSAVLLLCSATLAFFTIRIRWRRYRQKKAARGDVGGNYTAVYTRDDDDVTMTMSDNKHLLGNGREFDV